MKNFIVLNVLLCAFFIAPHAQAYILEHAVAGTLTLEVTGACAIPKTSVKAYVADISDDAHNAIGWGIVTASGHLIALRESAVDIVDQKNFTKNTARTTDHIDLAGATLKTFLTENGVRCEIAKLQSSIDSTVTYITNNAGGRALVNAKVAGYEIERCQDSGDSQSCKARKILGTIRFAGKW